MIFFVLFLDISGNRHPPASPSVRGFWDSGILTTPFLFSSGSHGSPLLLLVPQGSRFPFLSQLHRELFPDSSAACVPASRISPAHPRRLTASSWRRWCLAPTATSTFHHPVSALCSPSSSIYFHLTSCWLCLCHLLHSLKIPTPPQPVPHHLRDTDCPYLNAPSLSQLGQRQKMTLARKSARLSGLRNPGEEVWTWPSRTGFQ